MGNYPAVNDYNQEFVTLEPGEYELELIEIYETDKNGMWLKDKNGESYELFVFDVAGVVGGRVMERFYFQTEGEYSHIRLSRFHQLLDAIGVDAAAPGETSGLIGKKCRATVTKTNAKDGRVFNNIKKYLPLLSVSAPRKEDDLPF